jgi:hypothetical protein
MSNDMRPAMMVNVVSTELTSDTAKPACRIKAQNRMPIDSPANSTHSVVKHVTKNCAGDAPMPISGPTTTLNSSAPNTSNGSSPAMYDRKKGAVSYAPSARSRQNTLRSLINTAKAQNRWRG